MFVEPLAKEGLGEKCGSPEFIRVGTRLVVVCSSFHLGLYTDLLF